MQVTITHFIKLNSKGDIKYENSKPVTTTTQVELPIKFGYGSYNEPRKLLNHDIDVDHIISISA